jgi:gas vesicle protein
MNKENGSLEYWIVAFLMGGFIGLVTGWLTAPRSGQETREEIRVKSSEVRDSAEQTVDEALASLRATAAEVSSRTEELRSQSLEALEEGQRQWAEATAEIRKAAQDAIEEIKATAETEEAISQAGSETS